MENIFAKRRARLLAMKAIRDNYIPGEKSVTCPHCGAGQRPQGRGAGTVGLPQVRLPLPHRRLLPAQHDSGPRLLPGAE